MVKTDTKRKQGKPKDAKSAKQQSQYTFISYSSTRVSTPKNDVQKEIVIQNENGKLKGSYSERHNGKQVINKEFKSQK